MIESRLLLISAILILIDIHIYSAIHRVTKRMAPLLRSSVRTGMWVITGVSILGLAWYAQTDTYYKIISVRQWVITGVLIIYASKLFTVIFILADDVQLGIRKALRFFNRKVHSQAVSTGTPITRSQFLDRAGIIAGGIPFVSLVTGIVSGATDYHVIRKTIHLPNLPKSFDGMLIGQISDIHSGTFFNKTAVQGGVDMLLNEKPDVIFFTGDLVNYETSEVNDYVGIFEKLNAPLGVYSVTGNHDYGNYRTWPNAEAKDRNFRDLLGAHRQMGYDILMNEHRMLQFGEDKIAIIGIENWGMGPANRFPKYGKLDMACQGMEEVPVRLLLSHDPSHWDAQVRPDFPQIDIMFAGHTHGFQMGIEVGNFKWSPSQYMYKQWAGLYREGNQYLYVNRGFGCIGYPGRIGMPPELTVIELKNG